MMEEMICYPCEKGLEGSCICKLVEELNREKKNE